MPRVLPISALLLCLLPGINSYPQGLLITNGGQLVADGSVKLVANNCGIQNNGTFTAATSTVVFTGNNGTSGSFLGGANTISFYNLTLNKTANGIQLNRSISVANLLSFDNGDSLFLNGYNIDLGSSGQLSGEVAGKRITGRTGGYVQASTTLNAPASATPGNLGLSISSTANIGATTIRRGHEASVTYSIFRYYDVIPANNSNLAATLVFNYFDAELNGNLEDLLESYISTDDGDTWNYMGSIATNTSLNTLTVTGVNSLSRFTISTPGNIPLPLQSLQLKIASAASGDVSLDWQATGTCHASDYFLIERSENGQRFTSIGRLSGIAGTSLYHFSDQPTGNCYYRIFYISSRGSRLYSNVVWHQQNASYSPISVWPNPLQQQALLHFRWDKDEAVQVVLFNQAGLRMTIQSLQATKGANQANIQAAAWPAGMYRVVVSGQGGQSRSAVFVKQ